MNKINFDFGEDFDVIDWINQLESIETIKETEGKEK